MIGGPLQRRSSFHVSLQFVEWLLPNPLVKEASSIALPGLARALISAGKLGQKSAEEIYQQGPGQPHQLHRGADRSGAVSAVRSGAHPVDAPSARRCSTSTRSILQRLPKDLLDPKICQAYRVVVLSKRNNRLIVATADPSDQQAAEKIKFATQMGVDWVIAEYDKLSQAWWRPRPPAPPRRSTASSATSSSSTSPPWRRRRRGRNEPAVAEVEDAPVVKLPAQDAARRLQHARVGHSLRALRAHLPRALPRRRRTARDRLAADRHQGQAGLAHQGHLAHGHLRKARAAGRPDEAQDRSRPRDRFPGQHPAHAVRREDRDPYPGSEQRTPGHRRAGLRAPRKRSACSTPSAGPTAWCWSPGPTGSGKTVSLYTCLNLLNKPGVNISTAEDPSEINLPGVNQVNVNDKAGLTFAAALQVLPAPGSGHHHGRRNPRPRNRRHRDQGRADRPPGAVDAAHQRRADDADADAQHGHRALQHRLQRHPDHRAAAGAPPVHRSARRRPTSRTRRCSTPASRKKTSTAPGRPTGRSAARPATTATRAASASTR